LETMKRVGKIAIWLATGLVLSAGARADSVASAGNPYTPIVARNVFGLNPASAETAPSDPPPKITANGIMSVFGKLQVLFKVAGTGKPGQPAKDRSYILSEGQRQDDIEVLQIDDKTNLVTFNNHGTVQEIPLANAPAVTGSGGGQGGGQVSRANFSGPMGGSTGGTGGNVIGNSSGGGGVGRHNRGLGNNANQNPNPAAIPMEGGSALQSIPTRDGNSGQQQPQNAQVTVTPEEQIINMEIQRTLWQAKGNPAASIIPPTVLTHGEGSAGGTPPAP
jgi:hypothetical protein